MPTGIAIQVAKALGTLILTLGTGYVMEHNIPQYLLLTDRRLMCFLKHRMTGRPVPEVIGDLPRSDLRVTRFRGRLSPIMHLAVAGDPKPLKLSFPIPARRDARLLAGALGADQLVARSSIPQVSQAATWSGNAAWSNSAVWPGGATRSSTAS
jgi:hypothetical protein